jgi:hypothetical protein
MMVSGLVLQMTGESAQRAALGRRRDRHGRDRDSTTAAGRTRRSGRLRQLRPDMILLVGRHRRRRRRRGRDGRDLAAANPRPRFGAGYQLPVIYAGNTDAPRWKELLGTARALARVANLRPSLGARELGPARDAIHELFMEHVMAHAPGYRTL